MSDERMIRALGRLEQALLRAEAAGDALARSAGADAAAREAIARNLAALQSRHAGLRATAGAAIDRLDALIGAQPEETARG
jgi:hypothetical protein